MDRGGGKRGEKREGSKRKESDLGKGGGPSIMHIYNFTCIPVYNAAASYFYEDRFLSWSDTRQFLLWSHHWPQTIKTNQTRHFMHTWSLRQHFHIRDRLSKCTKKDTASCINNLIL